jgi:hypothetical protein
MNRFPWSAIAALLASGGNLLGAEPPAANGPDRLIYSPPLSAILGSTHVSGRYHFTDRDFLNEGADQLVELGMGGFKGWLTPGFRTAYPYNSDWPQKVDSLVDLVRTPYFEALLAKPFSAYSFVVGEFKPVDWKRGVSPQQRLSIENESYALARYLLLRYRHTGKTFILQNWEGDNALRAWDIADPKEFERARQGMVDWLNARQDGINRARRECGMHGVQVVGAVEITRTPVGRAPFDHPLVIDTVVPHTRADLYAFSTWGTRLPGDEALLYRQLDYMASKAPPSELYGNRNLMMGEFGAYELTYTSPDNNYPANREGLRYGEFGDASGFGQLIANRKQLEYALRWGVQFAFYWEVYCNGLRDGVDRSRLPRNADGHIQVGADQLKGVWLIRPDGSKVPTWYYFRNLISGGYIADTLQDWSRVYARSEHLQRPQHMPFVGNQSELPGSVLYQVTDLHYTAARVLVRDNHTTLDVRFAVSIDGRTWVTHAHTQLDGPPMGDTGWRFAWLVADIDQAIAGRALLRIQLAPTSADRVRLHKVIAESAAVASDPNRKWYRFTELDLLWLGDEVVDGFDPAMTTYRAHATPAARTQLGYLPADPRITVEQQTDDARSTRVQLSFPGESSSAYTIQW